MEMSRMVMRQKAVPWFRRLVTTLSSWRPVFPPRSVHVDLWWTKWHRAEFSFEFFGFPLSVSFHRVSIIRASGGLTIGKLVAAVQRHEQHGQTVPATTPISTPRKKAHRLKPLTSDETVSKTKRLFFINEIYHRPAHTNTDNK
jgi:hypothetical protein